jgi:predicted metal-dependent peptidase
MKLTAEQRVQRAHVWLMNDPKYCLYSGIFMLGKTTISETMPTAATNGRDVVYGRAFVEGLTDKEIRALVLHENLHKAFRHLTVWKELYKKNPQKANRACDYVINLMIYDSDTDGTHVMLPDGGCLDEKYRGLNAKQVFDLLPDDEGGGGGGGGGFDEHDWEGAGELSQEEQTILQRDIDQALRQGAILAGKMQGNIDRSITELLTPKVDWREALRDFVTAFCQDKDLSTWRKPNRRWVDQNVYLPSLIGESVGPLVLAIDTSGSIGGEILNEFLSEVVSICNTVVPERIDLLYWDTHVAGHEKYEPDSFSSIMQSTKPKGGGGTDVCSVFEYVKKKALKPEAVIVLSDGYTPWPEAVGVPTLFAINTDVVAPVGKTVRIG